MTYNYEYTDYSVSDNAIHYYFSNIDYPSGSESLQVISDKIDTLNDTISNGSFILIFSIGILIGFFTLKSVFGRV